MRASPTPLRRAEARRRAVAGVLALLACAPLRAHELTADPLPELPGWRVGAAVAVTALGAGDPIPSPTLPGILDTGQTAPDQRGLKLEHATLAGALRLNDWLGASLAVGWHIGENVHVEAAWLQARRFDDSGQWLLGAGIHKVPMGAVLTSAGDYGRFSLTPLVKRASLNTDWYDEGGVLGWRGDADGLLREVDIGLWRGLGFPGGGDLPAVPSLHVQLGVGELLLDGFYAYLQPTGRGTLARGPNSPGHTHEVPNCNFGITGLVCFDGRVNLVGGSFSWRPDDGPLLFSGAVLWRDEQGSLYSASGDARYHGRTLGGWLDVAWDFQPNWQLAARYEGLQATQDLAGPGALQVAVEAGLLPNWPASRTTLALAWSPDPVWRLSAELGNERSSGANNPFVMLRAIWTMPELLAGRW
ncbi:MAG: hypothetical protein J0M00_18760 [Burkholderiales bacterium]|nr:hypothetical protein [Burkholderiales bacterium]